MATDARSSLDEESTYVTTNTPQSLSKAVFARRAEYTKTRKIRIKVGSWNVAARPGTHNDLAGWFVDGKGIDKRLAGLRVTNGIKNDHSQDNVESVEDQEARRSKKESTIPHGDEGTIVGGDQIGLYVLGLQEVVELSAAKEYIGRVYTDTGPITKWRNAFVDALPPGYELIAEQQLSGLLLFIFASPAVAPTISSVSSVSVGTGIMGYLGNKGAVSTRIILGETTRMVFVNSHLASGTDPAHLDRRCWDVSQILSRTRFAPISWAGVLEDKQEAIGDEDFAFWFGDLNFRLEGLPVDDIRRLLLLHTRGEYDLESKARNGIENELGDSDDHIIVHHSDSDDDSDTESSPKHLSNSSENKDYSTLPDPDEFEQDPHSDPASLQATLDSLLPHDQLGRVRKARKAFHDGWREGPVTFLPTYKYDVGSMGMFDSSEKKRTPSWCDRILFRTRRDKLEYENKIREEEQARIKDEDMKARGMEHATEEEDVLFDYDPEADGVEDNTHSPDHEYYDDGLDDVQPDVVLTKEGYMDKISLDVYTSHQRVLSSDHKPLDAVFTIEYDAVVPELKSKVQAEVAKELDRAENEGRPGITVIVDHGHEVDDASPNGYGPPATPPTDGTEGADFGEVAYRQRKFRYLTIANTGQVPASFAFVSRPSDNGIDRISPEWIRVSLSSSDSDANEHKDVEKEVTLEPGETINASLEIFVENVSLVKDLNHGEARLEDVLVLRVTGGRDHFIPVRASWLQSCFGRSIDELIRIPEGGVRALLPGSNGKYVNRGQQVCWSAPRELFKLTEAVELLAERVVADAQMLQGVQLPKETAGWPFDKDAWLLKNEDLRQHHSSFVLDALDHDKNLDDCFPPEIPAIERIEVIAEVLLLLLTCLPDGIITEELWVKLEQERPAPEPKHVQDTEAAKEWVLEVLSTSPNHSISFVFLTAMLSKIASEFVPAPPPRPNSTALARSSIESVRRSLSFRAKSPPAASDPADTQRQAVERRFAEIFAPAVFRVPAATKEKDRKGVEERQRGILETFLKTREFG